MLSCTKPQPSSPLSRKNSEGKLPTKPRPDVGQPSGAWSAGEPTTPRTDNVFRVPDQLRQSDVASVATSSEDEADSSANHVDVPVQVSASSSVPVDQSPSDVVVAQPRVAAPPTSAVSTVLKTIKESRCACLLIVGIVAMVTTGVVAGVLMSRREDGTPSGAPPSTAVEQLTKLVQEWLCKCGFVVDENTCHDIAEEFAYSVGPSHSDSGQTGDVPRGWGSAQLWSQCPSASELVVRLPGQSDAAYAQNNAAQWAENHADRREPITAGQEAVMVQFVMLIAAVAISAILQG